MLNGLNRRALLASASVALLSPGMARAATARKTLAVALAPRDVILQAGQPPVPAWRFVSDALPRFGQGDAVDLTVTNRLPVPALVFVRGLDGAAALEPLLARQPIPPGGSAIYPLDLVHAGTMLLDARLGGGEKPLPVLPIVVTERAPPASDHDGVLLIEDWRIGSQTVFTVNGETSWTLSAQPNDRLRLRFINGAQRAVLAAQIAGAEVRVVALDGQPSEPFPASDGRIVLAPGARLDAIVDATTAGPYAITVSDGEITAKIGEITATGPARRAAPFPGVLPLPSNGLPEKLSLQTALRIDVPLAAAGGPQPPLYRVKRGRTVVLALQNTAESAVIFHLHGHHMRLLDRLDDGWKPFWLDTIAVPAKQTVRLAFAATNPGSYLMEIIGTARDAQRAFRGYVVEP